MMLACQPAICPPRANGICSDMSSQLGLKHCFADLSSAANLFSEAVVEVVELWVFCILPPLCLDYPAVSSDFLVVGLLLMKKRP